MSDEEYTGSPHTMKDDFGEDVPRPIATAEEYDQIQGRLDLLIPDAERIASRLCGHAASFVRFEIGSVMYSYVACPCADCSEGIRARFPATYLFDPEWESKHITAQREAEAEKQRAAERLAEKEAAKRRAERAREERREYERLKEKFEGTQVE